MIQTSTREWEHIHCMSQNSSLNKTVFPLQKKIFIHRPGREVFLPTKAGAPFHKVKKPCNFRPKSAHPAQCLYKATLLQGHGNRSNCSLAGISSGKTGRAPSIRHKTWGLHQQHLRKFSRELISILAAFPMKVTRWGWEWGPLLIRSPWLSFHDEP